MQTVNKSINLRRLLFVVPLFVFSCNNDPDGDGNLNRYNTDEVRIPRVEDIGGKAVITWVDPYITDTKEILVRDMQTGNEIAVPKGTQKAEFPITDPSLPVYRYELKVVKTSGSTTDGIIVRLVKNWAKQVHPTIDYHSTATPQSGLFFRNQPAARVKVFDIRQDEKISQLTSAVMQGVVNQEHAESYLVWIDTHLEQLVDAGIEYDIQPLAGTSVNKGFASMYNAYKDRFERLVLWDEGQPWSWSLAVMISAQQKGIPVTLAMKEFIDGELGGSGSLEVLDIRSMWNNNAEAYQWAIDNLAGGCHKKICFSAGLRSDYKDNPWRMHDYAAACKGFCFWLNENDAQDGEIMRKIFDKMQYPVGASLFGYGMNANGDDLNKFTNTHNVGFVVSDYYANGSFWCSLPGQAFQQRKGVAATAEPGKIYVAISLSDGDNVQFDQNSLYRIFKEANRRGDVPVGVTLAAGLQELNPSLLEFFYKNLTPNDELTAGPSGFQFIYGDDYDKSGKYGEWLDMNRKWLSTAGFHTSHLWLTTNQTLFKQYMEQGGADLVLDGSDRTSAAADKCVNRVVRLNQGTHCWGKGDVYRDLMSVSPSTKRPVFRHIYLLVEYYGFDGDDVVIYERLIDELQRIEQDSPGTYEYMLPMDLGATIAKYVEQGGVY